MGVLPQLFLICGLCKRAKVMWDEDEVLQPPKQVINHAIICRYKVWEGGVSHPRGAEFVNVNDSAYY